MAKVNAKGVNALPNELQNIQTNSNPSNFDQSHIICNDDGTIDVKGTFVFSTPQPIGSVIQSNDLTSQIVCLDGQQINISTATPSGFNNGGITIDGAVLSQQMICYGEADRHYGIAVSYTTFSLMAPNQEAGIITPNILVKAYMLPDMSYWFSQDNYNIPNNNVIVYNGVGFSWTYADRAMVEVEITWQLNLQGSGNTSQYLCIGLFDSALGVPVPQSIQWQQFAGNVGSKYLTFKTHFTVKRDNTNKLIPFYQQSNDPSYVIQNSSCGGSTGSSIKFKMYQYLGY